MRKVGILLSLVLLSSFSLVSAVETPDGESEGIGSYSGLSREDQMIFREQAAECGDLFYKVVSEPAVTKPQMLEKYNLCLIENLDVNKSFMRLLELNDVLLQQNSALINQTGQLTDEIIELSDASIVQSQKSANNTFIGMMGGGAITLLATFFGIKAINKNNQK